MAEMVSELRRVLVDLLSQGNWDTIKTDHLRVGLPWREELGTGWGKPKYVKRALAELSDEDVVALGRRCLTTLVERVRLDLENALSWIDSGGKSELSELTRRTVARGLDGRTMTNDESPGAFLSRLATTRDRNGSRAGYIGTRLVVSRSTFYLFDSNSEETWDSYTHAQLLEEHGFFGWPDQRVFQFLQQLVDPVTRGGTEQAEWVSFLNGMIEADGFLLVETSRVSRQPVFTVQRSTLEFGRRPKNLIFASRGPKPELGFSDALANDVVILRNSEHCLIYDDPFPDEGLTWDVLVAWWGRGLGLDPTAKETRQGLGARLRESLGSEAEKALFSEYFRTFGKRLGSRLPALIPQVYLHYDPRTLKELSARGESSRFLVQRMDFLLLLRDHRRVVVEVDGQQHYSEGEGAAARPSPAVYASTVRGDRELRLAGYDVFRFGGYELSDRGRAATAVEGFFTALFRRYAVLSDAEEPPTQGPPSGT